MTNRGAQRGQALILVVVGMVGLIGMTALAIDGGSAYSDRRHAQNAADTSAMAAGLAKIRNPGDWPVAEAAGYFRAADNGYDNNGTSNIVHVYQCTDPDATCALPAGESPENFIQVTISSVVPTYFGRVVGITDLNNSVQAIAKSVPPAPIPWYNGNALVATMSGCKTPGWPNDPFTLSGNSVSLVTGAGGVFVNSNCDNAFTANSNTTMDAVSGICVVGGVVNNGNVNPPPDDYCGAQMDPDAYRLPAVDASSCPSAGQFFDLGGGNYVATPGNYNSSFPSVAPAGTLKLQKGIYCLNDGLSLSGSWTITTDIDGNGTFDGSDGGDEGVLLYVPNGSVTFNGSSDVHIGAINKAGTDPGIKGYLLYVPPSNNSTVKITGGNGSTFIGTILAPSSLVTLEGGTSTDSLNLECQIIGYSVNVTGGGTLNIQYNQGKVGATWTNPLLELYR
ncbi:MAG: pilus assembly protein TadG-related protein [Chloroflexota bacterium]